MTTSVLLLFVSLAKVSCIVYYFKRSFSLIVLRLIFSLFSLIYFIYIFFYFSSVNHNIHLCLNVSCGLLVLFGLLLFAFILLSFCISTFHLSPSFIYFHSLSVYHFPPFPFRSFPLPPPLSLSFHLSVFISLSFHLAVFPSFPPPSVSLSLPSFMPPSVSPPPFPSFAHVYIYLYLVTFSYHVDRVIGSLFVYSHPTVGY